eukprot:2458254-Pleurochrysis_carterae.AAC.2
MKHAAHNCGATISPAAVQDAGKQGGFRYFYFELTPPLIYRQPPCRGPLVQTRTHDRLNLVPAKVHAQRLSHRAIQRAPLSTKSARNLVYHYSPHPCLQLQPAPLSTN